MDGVHDMGGMHGFGPVVVPGCERVADAPWELRVFALSTLVGSLRLGAGGGRAIREELDPAAYLQMSYYERWLFSTEERVLRNGTVTQEELDAMARRLAAGESPPEAHDPAVAEAALADEVRRRGFAAAESPTFTPGDRVRVRRMRPEGHTRCPRYVRGAMGLVDAVRGADVFPDVGPYRGPLTPVYAVAFRSDDLFGPSEEQPWTVTLDLFESYLEAA